jgi:hypothetical protein
MVMGITTLAGAQTPPPAPFAPGVKYDRAIPTLRQVLGHDSGEKITTPDEIAQYLKALQSAAPDRTRLVEYARTWENRPLYVLIVSSAERIAKLDEIKKGLQRLADPRGASAADLDGLIKSLPRRHLAPARRARQ